MGSREGDTPISIHLYIGFKVFMMLEGRLLEKLCFRKSAIGLLKHKNRSLSGQQLPCMGCFTPGCWLRGCTAPRVFWGLCLIWYWQHSYWPYIVTSCLYGTWGDKTKVSSEFQGKDKDTRLDPNPLLYQVREPRNRNNNSISLSTVCERDKQEV